MIEVGERELASAGVGRGARVCLPVGFGRRGIELLFGHACAQRQQIPIVGFTLIANSLHCVEELCFPDFDADMPARTLYHGVQQWVCDVEEMG